MILKKIKQDKFQLYLPNSTDQFGDVIDWDGDNGLDNTWGYYHMYLDANFLLAGMDDVQETSPSNISDDGVKGNNISNQAAISSASNGAGNDDTLLVDSYEESDTETEEKNDDDSVQGKDIGNQAALLSASNSAGNDNTVLVDNVAQENTDEAKQAASNDESDTETEEKNYDNKSSSFGLQNLQRVLGVTGMVKQLVYQHTTLPTKKTPRCNVFTAEWIYHGIFTSFMWYCPVDDLNEYRKAIYFSLSNSLSDLPRQRRLLLV
jgi:hypothetical protein